MDDTPPKTLIGYLRWYEAHPRQFLETLPAGLESSPLVVLIRIRELLEGFQDDPTRPGRAT